MQLADDIYILYQYLEGDTSLAIAKLLNEKSRKSLAVIQHGSDSEAENTDTMDITALVKDTLRKIREEKDQMDEVFQSMKDDIGILKNELTRVKRENLELKAHIESLKKQGHTYSNPDAFNDDISGIKQKQSETVEELENVKCMLNTKTASLDKRVKICERGNVGQKLDGINREISGLRYELEFLAARFQSAMAAIEINGTMHGPESDSQRNTPWPKLPLSQTPSVSHEPAVEPVADNMAAASGAQQNGDTGINITQPAPPRPDDRAGDITGQQPHGGDRERDRIQKAPTPQGHTDNGDGDDDVTIVRESTVQQASRQNMQKAQAHQSADRQQRGPGAPAARRTAPKPRDTIERPVDDSDDLEGFQMVERRPRQAAFFVCGIKIKNSPDETKKAIINYLRKRNIKVTHVRLLKRGRMYMSVKVNIDPNDKETVTSSVFWPDGVQCREWVYENGDSN